MFKMTEVVLCLCFDQLSIAGLCSHENLTNWSQFSDQGPFIISPYFDLLCKNIKIYDIMIMILRYFDLFCKNISPRKELDDSVSGADGHVSV